MTIKIMTDPVQTVADLICALEKIDDKTLPVTVTGEAGGDHWHSPEEFDRGIKAIRVESYASFPGYVEIEI